MQYKNIIQAEFISRPNRFVAYAKIDGETAICHVKNTGRCRELLLPKTKVWLEKSDNVNRKTMYDLVAVEKNKQVINIDSQAPNKVFGEWAAKGGLVNNLEVLKAEQKWGNSRFDYYWQSKTGEKGFVEIKGVTLEVDGGAFFPDAPTERGVKHIKELIACKQAGYQAMICFVIQMKQVQFFSPNKITHPEFAQVIQEAARAGVKIAAKNCLVTSSSLEIGQDVEVRL